MDMKTVLEQLAPIECRIAAQKTLNPHRKAWAGWNGQDYNFALKKGNRTVTGYFTNGHAIVGDPTPADIFTYIALECQRATECPKPADWVASCQKEYPGCKVDLSVAEFELRYARGLLDRMTMLLGAEGVAMLLAAVNGAPKKAATSLAVKPVKAAETTPAVAHKIVAPKKPKTVSLPVAPALAAAGVKSIEVPASGEGTGTLTLVPPRAAKPIVLATPLTPTSVPDDIWP
jgi:hypothetical protein